jgi:TatD DNase family protein
MNIIDTHTHYNAEPFNDDIDDCIRKAKEAGVKAIFNTGDCLESFNRILKLEEQYPSFCYSVLGIHPEFALKDEAYFEKSYQEIIDHKDVIKAIGEIGLDYHYSKEPEYIAAQKKRFVEQIRLAKKLALPIVVHARDADFDTLNIIKEELPEKVDLHCFSGSVEILKEYLKLPIDFHIGIGGVCTFRNAKVIKEVIDYAPVKILLTETDAPYLAPVPFRGQRNESRYIPYVIHEIATIKTYQDEELSEILYQQGKEFYGI